VPYDEPPIWFYPIRESLGAALLLAGKTAEAERSFRDDLKRHPRNARALFGLHAALVKQGRDSDAAWVRRAFDEAWKDADVTLTLESL
jgi:cytochrome c-type biogenesis protein CcmH/NrfG